MIHTCISYASGAPDNSRVTYGKPPADPRDIIERLRVARGFRSLRALALEAGVSQPTLQRYMTHQTEAMEVGNLLALAQTLGVTLSELIGEVPIGSSAVARDLQRLVFQLSDSEQEQLLRIGQALRGDPGQDGPH